MTLVTAYPSLIAALTIWREARGESLEAKRGVAWVIFNRMSDERWPDDPIGVCRQKFQFSCWLPADPNFSKFPDPAESSWLWSCEAWESSGDDLTNGANHYHSFSEPADFPKWADPAKVTAKIGAFTFYKL